MTSNSTFFPVLLCLLFVLFLEGCSKAKKNKNRTTLHNYPVISDDCPIDYTLYDEDEVRARAKELGMRPVDYLHWVNNKKKGK